MKIFVLSPDIDFSPSILDGTGRIVSVFLIRGGNGIQNFRCIQCGKIAFQYAGGAVDSIFDGAVIPSKKSSVDVMCHRCKIIYRTY